MGCGPSRTVPDGAASGNHNRERFGSNPSHSPLESPKNSGSKDTGRSRIRRLSHTILEDENQTSNGDKFSSQMIAVPVPVCDPERPAIRQRKERRKSYLQLNIDPSSKIVGIAQKSLQGSEDYMPKMNQDSSLVLRKSDLNGAALNQCIFGVFDGHGRYGHLCSDFVQTSIPALIEANIMNDHTTTDSIKAAMALSDMNMIRSKIDCSMSGTTATIAILQAFRLVVAWVGDSPCYLIKMRPMILNPEEKKARLTDEEAHEDDRHLIGYPLSGENEFGWYGAPEPIHVSCRLMTDPLHTFSLLAERRRALEAGGRVMRWGSQEDFEGPLRIFQKDVLIPGLNMSRSFGDEIAHEIGVSSEADVREVKLSKDDKYIVLCSDGVTEFMNITEITQMILEAKSLQEACNQIIAEARSRWLNSEDGTADDCTCIIVELEQTTSEETEDVLQLQESELGAVC